MRRRHFLSTVTGLAAAPLLPATVGSEIDPTRALVAPLEEFLHHRSGDTAPITPAELHQGMTAARADFQAARYRQLATRLPGLLAAADATPAVNPAVRAALYNTATHLLIKLKTSGLGWITADRAMTAARTSGDPAVIADVTRNLATLHRQAGHYQSATHLALEAADQLTVTDAAAPDHLALYGTLLCNAGYTTALAGDHASTTELLDTAAQAATRLGGDHNAHGTAFGPANVVSHRISAAHALGEPGAAIAHARQVAPGTIRLPERRARYWIDVARAYHQWGKPARCYRALLTAERHAPDDVHARPVVRALATELLSAPSHTGMTGIREFAQRLGAAL